MIKMSNNFEKSTFEYNIKNELDEQWSLLKAKQNNEKIENDEIGTYSKEPFKKFILKDYYLVLDNENNKSIYLIHEGKKFKEDKKSANLSITMSVTNPREEINNYIVLTCHNNENSNIISNLFNTLISNILSKIQFENKSNRDSVKEAIQEYRDFFKEKFEAHSFDFVICSQVLNLKTPGVNNFELAQEFLTEMYRVARKGVACDFVTSYVDFKEDYLFYHSPEDIFAFSKTLSKRVTLRHDYPAFEFCVYLYPDFVGWENDKI